MGPDLPRDVTGGASVPGSNTFLVVGGKGGPLDYSNRILQYDPVAKAWHEREERVDQRTMFAGATLVDDENISCIS